MSSLGTSLKRWRIAPCGASLPERSASFHGLLVVLAALITLSGCASPFPAGFNAAERQAIHAGKTPLVLLRIKCSVDGQPWECFGNFTFSTDGPVVALGLGSFQTVGEPRSAWYRFLSDTSREAGWVFFLLPPGIHYLAAVGPQSGVSMRSDVPQLLRAGPRWRIDVPENSKLIYVGTLQLSGKDEGTLMFGGKIIRPADGEGAAILVNEDGLARSLLSEYFEDAAGMKTLLMSRWHPGDPIIIRSPGPNSAK